MPWYYFHIKIKSSKFSTIILSQFFSLFVDSVFAINQFFSYYW
ncbi:hypothetical protein RC62_297 [Flavobacterium aquidurense]|uniref:Uncharacterized protein n=1 Tax=Flavobacterium aquidurense TaxID=362413 RepID=A0A0Q0W1E8_9FLAO|nr:hypothetical protein RC62_297 [Flavobacterium aquidurense]